MRLTIIGAGTSAPQPETPASGILVETASTALLIDCGQGVIRGLMAHRDPRDLDAIIVGHLHADHYIDLVSLRYLMPWTGFTGRRIPVLLPPGGRARVDQLAAAISEREQASASPITSSATDWALAPGVLCSGMPRAASDGLCTLSVPVP